MVQFNLPQNSKIEVGKHYKDTTNSNNLNWLQLFSRWNIISIEPRIVFIRFRGCLQIRRWNFEEFDQLVGIRRLAHKALPVFSRGEKGLESLLRVLEIRFWVEDVNKMFPKFWVFVDLFGFFEIFCELLLIFEL